MNREVVDRLCERGILFLVIAILVVGPLGFGAVRAPEFLVVQALSIGVLVLWCVRLWAADRPRILIPPITWAVVAFVVYSLARYLTADVQYIARQEVVRVSIYAFLFFAILNHLHRQETTRAVSIALICVAMMVAGYAIYQYATGSDSVWNLVKPYKNRGSGTFINPNHLGGFLEMLVPLALAFVLAGRFSPVTRVLIGYAGIVMLAGIVVTGSRGSWISTIAALVVVVGVLAFNRYYRLPLLALVGVIAVAGIFLMPRDAFLQSRARQLINRDGEPRDGLRFALWEPAWRMWEDHPLWGVGPGHFDARFGGYRPAKVQNRPDRVHNDYINLLADWGLAGAIPVGSALALLTVGVVRTWRKVRRTSGDLNPGKGSNKMAFVLGASAGLVAILVHSAVDFNLHIPANAIVATTLVALLTGHLRFASDRYWKSLGGIGRSALTLVLVAGALCLTWEGTKRGREYVWLAKANRAQNFSTDFVRYMKKAWAADPTNPETAYNLGEALRRQSQEGGEFYEGMQGLTYADLAREAMTWYGRGIKLNPWFSYNYLGYGWCLDWLNRSAESPPYFNKALELEENSYFVMNQVGLHYVETGNYPAARAMFERSLRLAAANNHTARSYLAILDQRLRESGADDLTSRLRETIEGKK